MIKASDIRLLECERMSDTPDGGGRRTSRVIQDGVKGNIFPKVSRLDAVYGRVNLRKIYGAVQTDDLDTYAGAHAIITDAPDNAKIHVTLFSTGSEFDTRSNARDRIESYVTRSSESRMVLVGKQLAGQLSIAAYQRPEEALPEVGEVYCLSDEAGAAVNFQQYVRVSEVEHEIRTYTDDTGDFKRRFVRVWIGVPLRYDFSGPDTPSRLSSVARSSRIRETTVVDAARYFGIQKLTDPAPKNSAELKVDSVYTHVVPTTNRETPLSQVEISSVSNMIVAAPSPVSQIYSPGTSWPVAGKVYCRRGILPGSVSITFGATTVSDDKLGGITAAEFTAQVDYDAGVVTRTGGSTGSTSYTITTIPAASAGQPAHMMEVPVNIATRGTSYSLSLLPLPSISSVTVDYRALGKWYRLRANAAGKLSGADAAYGIGSVDHATGALVLTLGALPDVGTSVLVHWGAPAHYSIRVDDASPSAEQVFILPDVPVVPNSVSVVYTSDGETYTVIDTLAGVLGGGGAAGTINYTTGEVRLRYSDRLPDYDTAISVAYQHDAPVAAGQENHRSASIGMGHTLDIGSPVAIGTLEGTIPTSIGRVRVKDDGAGSVQVQPGIYGNQAGAGGATGGGYYTVAAASTIGTINYASGIITINADFTAARKVFQADSISYKAPVMLAPG